jgi:hypothetical protein
VTTNDARGEEQRAGHSHGCFQQSMKGDIQELPALGISTDEKTQENKNITFGSLEGSRITNRWIWALFSNEMEKG